MSRASILGAAARAALLNLLSGKADASSVYTQAEVDALLVDYYTAGAIDALLAADYYTQAEVDALIAGVGGGGGGGPTTWPMLFCRSASAYIALASSAVWGADTGSVWTIEFLHIYAANAAFAGPIAFGSNGDEFIVFNNVGRWDLYPTALPSGYHQTPRDTRMQRVSITRNGTDVRVYFDGALVDKLTYSTAAAASLGGSQRRLMGDGVGEGMAGQALADLRIFNVVRTQDEIVDNAFERLTGSETGLLAYWKMDEGTGTTVADSGPNGYDGTINGTIDWIKAVR